jgi:hypothetical protein
MKINGITFKEHRHYRKSCFGKNGMKIEVYPVCPVCSRKHFSKNVGFKLHLVGKTRSSDIEHARLLVKVYPEYKPKIQKYIQKHLKSIQMLNQI